MPLVIGNVVADLGGSANTSSRTIAGYTPATGSDKILFVLVAAKRIGITTQGSVNACSFNGTPMVKVGEAGSSDGTDSIKVALFASPIGSSTAPGDVVILSSPIAARMNSLAFTVSGLKQQAAEAFQGNNSSADSTSVTTITNGAFVLTGGAMDDIVSHTPDHGTAIGSAANTGHQAIACFTQQPTAGSASNGWTGGGAPQAMLMAAYAVAGPQLIGAYTMRRGSLTRSGHGGVPLAGLIQTGGSTVTTWSIQSGNTSSALNIDSSTGAITPAANGNIGTYGPFTLVVRGTDAGGSYAECTITLEVVDNAYTVSKYAEIDSTSTGLRNSTVRAALAGKKIQFARGITDVLWTAGNGLRFIQFGVDTTQAYAWSETNGVYFGNPLTLEYEDPDHPYTFISGSFQSVADIIVKLRFKNSVAALASQATNEGTQVVNINVISTVRPARIRFTECYFRAVDDAYNGNTATLAIRMSDAYQCEIDNCTFDGASQFVTPVARNDGVHIHHNTMARFWSDALPQSQQNQNIVIEDNIITRPMYAAKWDGVHTDGVQLPTSGAIAQDGFVLRRNVIDQQGGERAMQGCLLSVGSAQLNDPLVENNIIRVSKPIGLQAGTSVDGFYQRNTVTNAGLDLSSITNPARVRVATSARGGLYSSAGTSSGSNVNPSVSQPAGTRVRAWVDKSASVLTGTPYAAASGYITFVASQTVPANTPSTDGSNMPINSVYWTIDTDFTAIPPTMDDTEGTLYTTAISVSGSTSLAAGNLADEAIQGTVSDGGGNEIVDGFSFQDAGGPDVLLGLRPADAGPVTYAGALFPDGSWNDGSTYS